MYSSILEDHIAQDAGVWLKEADRLTVLDVQLGACDLIRSMCLKRSRKRRALYAYGVSVGFAMCVDC